MATDTRNVEDKLATVITAFYWLVTIAILVTGLIIFVIFLVVAMAGETEFAGILFGVFLGYIFVGALIDFANYILYLWLKSYTEFVRVSRITAETSQKTFQMVSIINDKIQISNKTE